MMITIQRQTMIVQIMGIVLGISTVCITVMRWFSDQLPMYLRFTYHSLGFDHNHMLDTTMPLSSRLIALAINSIEVMIVFAALITLMHLMHHFKQYDFFSLSTINLFHKLTRYALYWAIYNPVQSILLSVVTTIHKGPGNRIISLTFETTDIINIMLFAALCIITTMMQEGYKLKYEQDLTV